MIAQMHLTFYGFFQKLSTANLANAKTPWHHHFYYKSMKSENPVFTKNAEKLPTLAKC